MSIKYFDLQLNGYAGVDFNRDDLTESELYFACEKLKEDGVKGVLATIITADINQMIKRLNRVVQLREDNTLIREMIYGIHIEGPFLSSDEGYHGAHNPKWIFNTDIDLMKKLLDAAGGLTQIVTLAPERDDGFQTTKMLTKDGIVVSAGHTNASLDVLNAALDNGLSMYTHLGNGCPVNMDRHDNIIQRVLSLKDKIWKTFIADGWHIPDFALKNYLDLVGYKKSIIVTDAMAAASAKPGKYTIGELELEVGIEGIVRRKGDPNFAGSAITMQKSRQLLQERLNISDENIKMMLSDNPKRALGISDHTK
jgi:N-acetylglucosamine-6-phosphate deacetylase